MNYHGLNQLQFTYKQILYESSQNVQKQSKPITHFSNLSKTTKTTSRRTCSSRPKPIGNDFKLEVFETPDLTNRQLLNYTRFL